MFSSIEWNLKINSRAEKIVRKSVPFILLNINCKVHVIVHAASLTVHRSLYTVQAPEIKQNCNLDSGSSRTPDPPAPAPSSDLGSNWHCISFPKTHLRYIHCIHNEDFTSNPITHTFHHSPYARYDEKINFNTWEGTLHWQDMKSFSWNNGERTGSWESTERKKTAPRPGFSQSQEEFWSGAIC